jgi:DNA-binding transcriptional regulator YiaG
VTSVDLINFLKKYDITDEDFAEIIGVTPTAVKFWLRDQRKIPGPVTTLVKVFEMYPNLMKELNERF